MTREEAALILDPETSRDALLPYESHEERIAVCEDACRLGAAALRDQDERRWIPVTELLPDNETDVLICVERRHYSDPGKFIRLVVKAFYTDGQHNTEDSAYTWQTDYIDMDYDEGADAYIIPEGWWECVDYGEEFCAVSDFVTHWMPLPELQKEDAT